MTHPNAAYTNDASINPALDPNEKLLDDEANDVFVDYCGNCGMTHADPPCSEDVGPNGEPVDDEDDDTCADYCGNCGMTHGDPPCSDEVPTPAHKG